MALTTDLFMSPTCDYYLSSWLMECSSQLESQGIVHSGCGHPFQVGFLDVDGRVLRHLPAEDAYEAVMYARCDAGCRGCGDEYNYSRLRITGYMLGYARDPSMQLKDLMLRAWDDLVVHLRGLVGQLNHATVAEIAEWVTQHLAARGTCLLSEVVKQFNLDDGKTDKLRDFMYDLGFVREGNWRTMPMPTVSYIASYASDSVPMPMHHMKIDTLLALPAEHPLAA